MHSGGEATESAPAETSGSLFVSQCYDRIHPRCAPRGKVAGEETRRDHDTDAAGNYPWIRGFNAEQEAAQHTRCRIRTQQSEKRPGNDESGAVPQNLRQHRGARAAITPSRTVRNRGSLADAATSVSRPRLCTLGRS